MILDIRPEWSTFELYLDAMSTKYRTRAKRAEKKFVGLKYLEMDVEMIENQQDTIYNLYNKIANEADFNYTFIHKNYFLELKKALGDAYRIVGCYDRNELVGFFSTIYNFDELETGFIGFDDTYNASHQIYLNFLYEMVKIGIEYGVKKVVFSRTALEIKSSIGAEPHLMQTYLKAQSPILNRFMPRVVTAISPKQDWQQRKPFK
jgi:predicted N-acyltransferase